MTSRVCYGFPIIMFPPNFCGCPTPPKQGGLEGEVPLWIVPTRVWHDFFFFFPHYLLLFVPGGEVASIPAGEAGRASAAPILERFLLLAQFFCSCKLLPSFFLWDGTLLVFFF